MSVNQTPPVSGLFRKLHIAFKYPAIIFFVISLYTFLSSCWLLYKAERIPGTVSDIISHTNRNRKSGATSTSYTPVFEFRYRGEVLHHQATFGSGTFTYDRNERVEMLINPDSGVVRANSFLELWFLPLMLAGAGAFFTLFAVVILKVGRVLRGASFEHVMNGIDIETNETRSNKRTYIVNERVDDNSTANKMDDLFDALNENKESGSAVKKTEASTFNQQRINQVNQGTPAWIKILIVLLIGVILAFVYLKFSGTNTPASDKTEADSTLQLTETIDGVPLTQTPVEPTEDNEEQASTNGEELVTTGSVFFIIRNQIVEVYDGETPLFSFPLPDGAAISDSDEHKSELNLSYPVQEGTNLSEKDFSFTIIEGACEPEEDESVTWSNKQIGEIDFVIGSGGGAGAGQYYQTENYSFKRYGYCMTFTLQLHSGNIGMIDPPVSQFDVAAEINFIENILNGIEFK